MSWSAIIGTVYTLSSTATNSSDDTVGQSNPTDVFCILFIPRNWRSRVTQTPEYIKQNNTSGRFLGIGVNLLTCVQPLDPVIRANKVHFRTNCEESTMEMKLHKKSVLLHSYAQQERQEKLRCETENPDSRPRRGEMGDTKKMGHKDECHHQPTLPRRCEAPDHSQGVVLHHNSVGTEQNRTVTCMVLNANDRRKNLALSCDEFRETRFDVTVDQVATWTLNLETIRALETFERKALRTIFGPVKDQGCWRTRYNFELYRLCKEPQVTQVIRSNRLRWLGHIWRSPENNQTRAYTFKNPMGSRTRERPPTRWI
ncbi:endonuclease-reverse transcriptase [Trichonephila clavipes]|nr:endonuclease-reverse transcriptase [Trichonephila clavipes]